MLREPQNRPLTQLGVVKEGSLKEGRINYIMREEQSYPCQRTTGMVVRDGGDQM